MSRQDLLLNSLESLKKKASVYAKSDRIGHVLARSFDLIGGAASDGVEAQSVRDLTEWLERDTEFAKEKDSNDVVPPTHVPRELVYGLIESLGPIFKEIAERKSEEFMLLKDQTRAKQDLASKEVQTDPSGVEHVLEFPREEPMYREMGIENMPRGDAFLGHCMKEELADETGELDNKNQLLMPTKEEEEEALFDAGFLVPVLEGGEEPMNNEGDGMEEEANEQMGKEDKQEEEQATTSSQRVNPLRISAPKSSPVTRTRRVSKAPKVAAAVAAAATPARFRNSPAQKRSSSSTSGMKKRNFMCNECSYAAAHPSELVIHKRYHTGERPFECKFDDFCTKSFVTQGNLNKHLRNVHNENKNE